MKRGDIVNEIYEASHNLDYQFIPWSNERVYRFTVEQVNKALKEAATAMCDECHWIDEARVRALKIE